MAGYWLDSTDPEVVQRWEKELEREVRVKGPLFDPANGFSGTGFNKLIKIEDSLATAPGATVTTTMRYQLDGRGRVGNEPLKGFGEAIKTATFSVGVDVFRHYVEVSSPMVDQYVHFDALAEGKDGLADLFASRFELAANMHATGFSIITDPAYTLNNTIAALASNYILRPNGKATAQALTTADIFDLDFLNQCALRLKLLQPLVRPISTPDGEVFAVFLASEQVASLRKSDSIWFQTAQNALKGGFLEKNPLFTNALGMSQGFVFFEERYVPPGINTSDSKIQDNTRRGWIGGAQALVLAFGRGNAPAGYALNKFRWDKETEDFGHVGQIAGTTIVGMKRPRYSKPGTGVYQEAGVLAFETYAEHGLDAATVYKPWIDAGASVHA